MLFFNYVMYVDLDILHGRIFELKYSSMCWTHFFADTFSLTNFVSHFAIHKYTSYTKCTNVVKFVDGSSCNNGLLKKWDAKKFIDFISQTFSKNNRKHIVSIVIVKVRTSDLRRHTSRNV